MLCHSVSQASHGGVLPAGDRLNTRGDRIDEQINKLDAQLVKFREQIKKTRPGPSQEALKRRALTVGSK